MLHSDVVGAGMHARLKATATTVAGSQDMPRPARKTISGNEPGCPHAPAIRKLLSKRLFYRVSSSWIKELIM
jgi:hypothetical protein